MATIKLSSGKEIPIEIGEVNFVKYSQHQLPLENPEDVLHVANRTQENIIGAGISPSDRLEWYGDSFIIHHWRKLEYNAFSYIWFVASSKYEEYVYDSIKAIIPEDAKIDIIFREHKGGGRFLGIKFYIGDAILLDNIINWLTLLKPYIVYLSLSVRISLLYFFSLEVLDEIQGIEEEMKVLAKEKEMLTYLKEKFDLY